MKIAVCVKQVPAVSMLRFDEDSRRVVREGVPNEVNPYDALGVTLAASLKAGLGAGAEVVAVSMGPPQASEALVRALALGADRAVHLNDRAFAGADTLATARALSAALRRERPDLIICGRVSADAETAQVGSEIAEMMDIPQITAASALEILEGGAAIRATRLTDEGYQILECGLPALVTVTDGVAKETFPRRDRVNAARAMPIETLTAADLSDDPSQFGAAGSPTSVESVYALDAPRRAGVIIRDAPPEDAVARLMEFLEERGAFEDAGEAESGRDERGPRTASPEPYAVWTLAETMGGEIRRVTFELLGESRRIASELDVPVEAVVMGEADSERVRLLTAYGADRVRIADDPRLAEYDSELHAAALAAAIRRHAPLAVLIPSTANGRDLAARVAGRLEIGLAGDCVGFSVGSDGLIAQLKPAFGGGVVAPILSSTGPIMATVRPGILAPCEPDFSIEPIALRLETPDLPRPRVRVLRTVADESSEGAELESARRVVAVGMGIGGAENLAPMRELAAALGASIGATRDVADAGWLPRQLQIGVSGKAVAPELYIAVGVRGPFNHTVGIQRAGTVVCVNSSARAAIFRAADFGIVADWRDIVPPLAEAARTRLGARRRGARNP